MKKIYLILIILLLIFIVGCGKQNVVNVETEQEVQNSNLVDDTIINEEQYVPSDSGKVVIVEKNTVVEEIVEKPVEKILVSKVSTSSNKVNQILAKGYFQGRTHSVEGEVKFYYSKDDEKTGQDNDKLLVLELDHDFNTAFGPELHIYLSTIVDPELNYEYDEGEFVDLGRVKEKNGQQFYLVPDYANNIPFQSVVVYSPAFHVVYGVAVLQ